MPILAWFSLTFRFDTWTCSFVPNLTGMAVVFDTSLTFTRTVIKFPPKIARFHLAFWLTRTLNLIPFLSTFTSYSNTQRIACTGIRIPVLLLWTLFFLRTVTLTGTRRSIKVVAIRAINVFTSRFTFALEKIKIESRWAVLFWTSCFALAFLIVPSKTRLTISSIRTFELALTGSLIPDLNRWTFVLIRTLRHALALNEVPVFMLLAFF